MGGGGGGGAGGPATRDVSSTSRLGAVSKGQPTDGRGGLPSKSLEVELRRRPGEGFGFVIASQDVVNGGELSSCLTHVRPPLDARGSVGHLPAEHKHSGGISCCAWHDFV